ncbi:hypothetical protein SLA2020_076050 [Shorea laevis]
MPEEEEVDRSSRGSLIPEEGEVNQRSRGSLMAEVDEMGEGNQTSKGSLVRLEDLSEQESFWQGFENESGQLKKWMGRKERKIKKQKKKKRLRSCSFVYKKSSNRVQPKKVDK